jgi:hypothetical protein
MHEAYTSGNHDIARTMEQWLAPLEVGEILPRKGIVLSGSHQPPTHAEVMEKLGDALQHTSEHPKPPVMPGDGVKDAAPLGFHISVAQPPR